MKKLLLSILGIGMLGLTACKKEEKVKIITPNGTPFMAIAGVMDENIEIENVDGADALVTALSTNSHDIVIAPLTAGAKTYVKGVSKYKLEACITKNNTYVISREGNTLSDIKDLEGKNLIAYGQNNTPDFALKNALALNNVNCNVSYESSVTNSMGLFLGNNGSSDYDYCLIAEPQLTQLKEKNNLDLNVLDLSEYMDSDIYQAGIFVSDTKNKKVEKVVEKIEKNIKYLNENPKEYANDIVHKNRLFEALTANVIEKSIPMANIEYVDSSMNKESIKKYFTLINNYNDKIIGGIIDEEFFI